MTLAEFRAFLDGLACANNGAPPNTEQWAEVLRRLALVSPDGAKAPTPPVLPGTVPWAPLPFTCMTPAQDFVCWN